MEFPATIPIIPMKRLSEGKSRLANQLTADQRAELVAGMLRRVISAVKSANIELFWVVGGDDRVRRLTRNYDGIWFEELGRNLNDTVTKGFERAFAQGCSALYLPGDLPFIKPSDLQTLFFRAGQRDPGAGPAGRRHQRHRSP